MKLVLAIVSREDGSPVLDALTNEHFQVTKLSTTGGFLKSGNTTLITGVEDSKVDEVVKIISKHSSKRTQVVPNTNTLDPNTGMGLYNSLPFEITVGGAIIFVLDVDRFEKV